MGELCLVSRPAGRLVIWVVPFEQAHPFDDQLVRTNVHVWPAQAHSVCQPHNVLRLTACILLVFPQPGNKQNMVNETNIPLTPGLIYSIM